MMQIINKIRNTIRRYQMLEKGDRVLVCISGGPDSCFLLEALLRLKDEFNIKLFIANLDHGIRGRESYEDS
ncbi:MAG: tRNA(Ile)-lysidine synthetase, partial [Candidatus Omnitrophica bacterium]|nr:tRNA(Ile)-lysidine synthetase [Candidatus Omnitrophota bacterium]